MLRLLYAFFSAVLIASGAIGDNAPSVPSTYVQSHPRLPYPDNTYLDTIWNNRTGGAAYIWMDANNWNSTSPSNLGAMRHLLLAYLSEKRHSGPNVSAFLTNIQSFTSLNNGDWYDSIAWALAYDWIYSDLGSTVQNTLRTDMYGVMSRTESSYSGGSPFNDQFYTRSYFGMDLLDALAIYPDDTTNSLPHLRWAMDVWINLILPAWKQIIAGGNECGTISSTDGSPVCGGMWHEDWSGYFDAPQNTGTNTLYVTLSLAWASASGRGVSNWFTIDNPWMKNIGYWLMYQTRPDFNLQPIQANSWPYLAGEYIPSAGLPGMLEGLAAVYNDPTLRGWARLLDWGTTTPNGYEPSAWPYYSPDSSAHPTNTRSVLALTKDFPGYGTVFFRTGWTENDTFCTLRYGDSLWSHPQQDTGAFTCFNRGALAIRSGDYRPGSLSPHFQYYAAQAISQNVPLVYDANDDYNAETVGTIGPTSLSDTIDTNEPMPNDGGQRRVGSGMGNYSGTQSSEALSAVQGSPSDIAQWVRGREYYHQGKLVAYAVGAGNKYSFAAVDMTDAYNNLYSRVPYNSANTWVYNTANTSNRSFRVRKAVRQFLFIPRGTAAYVVLYDQLISTNSAFVKKNLIHSINQPSVSGNAYTISRTETVTSAPYPGLWPQTWAAQIADCPGGCTGSSTQYTYNGKLYGWLTFPATGALSTVGGSGSEFQITDANGVHNWNQCMYGQCNSYGSIAGTIAGTYNITTSNDVLSIALDGGSAQTITLTTGSARTPVQVVSDINAQLSGGTASVQADGNGVVAIASNNTTGSSSVAINSVANNAYATLGFTVGTYTGAGFDMGFGAVGDYMHPSNVRGPAEPGAWRIEETTGTTQLSDKFINVMLVTSASDTNTVSTVPATITEAAGTGSCAAGTPGGCLVTTWKDNANTCTYSVTQPSSGVDAVLTVQGAGCSTVIN